MKQQQTLQQYIFQLRNNLFPTTIGYCNDKRRIHTTNTTTNQNQQQKQKNQKNEPAVLLLTGDEYLISNEGASRSLYKFPSSGFCIEELYYLNDAIKTFWIRTSFQETEQERVIEFSSSKSFPRPIQLQEMNYHQDRLVDNTGSMTWESSILMAIYLSSVCNAIKTNNLGHVLELGSGVGLGGILTKHLLSISSIKSITLTDHNSSILRKCHENVQFNTKNNYQSDDCNTEHNQVRVSHLDWNNIPSSSFISENKHYDTILASDVVYSKDSITSLCKTIKCLLNKNSGVAHIFGPNNRSQLHDFIQQLQSDASLSVQVETLQMERFRILPSSSLQTSNATQQHSHNCSYSMKQASNFLHITVTHSQNALSTMQTKIPSFSDID